MKLLHLDSSILGPSSVSRQLSAQVVEHLRNEHEFETVSRDLAGDPLPHLIVDNLPSRHYLAEGSEAGFHSGAGDGRAESDRVLREFLEADVVVIGAPMYNFTIPTQLKAWIDRILVAGVTFKYGPDGPEGLAPGKRVILALSRGGIYERSSPSAIREHAESYLRTVFEFVGIRSIEVVVAEGLAAGPDARSAGIQRAAGAVREIRSLSQV